MSRSQLFFVDFGSNPVWVANLLDSLKTCSNDQWVFDLAMFMLLYSVAAVWFINIIGYWVGTWVLFDSCSKVWVIIPEALKIPQPTQCTPLPNKNNTLLFGDPSVPSSFRRKWQVFSCDVGGVRHIQWQKQHRTLQKSPAVWCRVVLVMAKIKQALWVDLFQ